MVAQGAYGERVARYAGLKAAPAVLVRGVKNYQFAATRLTSDGSAGGITTKIPNESAYIISMQLRDFAHRQLWLDKRVCPHRSLAKGTINLYDLEADVVADVRSPFDSVQFYVPRVALRRFAAENDMTPVVVLNMEPGLGIPDHAVEQIAHALLPALENPRGQNGLFIDHLALALYAHLAQTYGSAVLKSREGNRQLAPWQERRAKELIMANLGGDVSLVQLADACGLSVSHFNRAFRQSTGVPPHRWLLKQRASRAKDLLVASELSLADIAAECGFADQSHFTRVFSQLVGVTPGSWRRTRKRW